MRLIDADELTDRLEHMPCHIEESLHYAILNTMLMYVNQSPTVQPEIIRCKDCKYNADTHKCLNPDSFFLLPNDDDFCSHAERREE